MKNKVIRLCICVLAIAFFLLPASITSVARAEQSVYLGGMPIGIGLAEDGLIVTGFVDVITDEGAVCPSRGTEILTGDLVIAVNRVTIMSAADFASVIQRSEGDVTLTVRRGERELSFTLTPATDSLTGLKKVGLTLKNGINGIGTLTFVLPENLKFGCLGHGIIDADTGKPFICDSGYVYRCEITAFKRPESGKAGELTGKYVDRSNPIGTIDRCNGFGVYGVMKKEIADDLPLIPIGNRKQVKTGKAEIYSTINGNKPKAYEIEIVKTSNQRKAAEKSMLIRVTDEELLRETGGILQGMSGSPIVQNGKLIGAVTHVLVNDSTLGYGLYLDWMLENVA